MAKQIINIGDTANDRKGDSLRTAFAKVNANFTEVYTLAGTGGGSTASSIDGGGAASIYTNEDLSIDGGAASTIFNNQ